MAGKKKDYSVKKQAMAGPYKKLTPFEKALIKANGDVTKIPGFKYGKRTK
jgi:hypothetical protein